MIRVNVDGVCSEKPIADGDRVSVRALIDEAFKTLPSDRIVTEILIDGKQLFSHQIAADTWETASVGEVEIRTANKQVWASQGIENCLSTIKRIQRSLLSSAELFRAERLAEANKSFSHCMEGLARFMEGMLLTRSVLSMDFSKITVEGISLAQVESDMSRVLRSILESQKQENYEELADKIEYELLTNVHCWIRALSHARENDLLNNPNN